LYRIAKKSDDAFKQSQFNVEFCGFTNPAVLENKEVKNKHHDPSDKVTTQDVSKEMAAQIHTGKRNEENHGNGDKEEPSFLKSQHEQTPRGGGIAGVSGRKSPGIDRIIPKCFYHFMGYLPKKVFCPHVFEGSGIGMIFSQKLNISIHIGGPGECEKIF
jgi:hypothetical protein